MNSGMYATLSGNLKGERRIDLISNNLSNINTPGYKRDKIGFEAMLAGALNQVPQSSTADPILQKEMVYVDYSPGLAAQTGNSFDIALEGDGFFVVDTPQGVAYTRQGNFKLKSDGTLVTVDGNPVQGKNGNILIKGANVEIDEKGNVKANGNSIAQIKVVDFPKPYALKKIGSALFQPENSQTLPTDAKTVVKQGYLEGSNVDVITEMALMIQASRDYETYQRVIRGFDDMNAKAVNELGRL